MDEKSAKSVSTVDKYDPDNWIHIPAFGVNPVTVNFEGFETKIIYPQASHQHELRSIISGLVKTARAIVIKLGMQLSDIDMDGQMLASRLRLTDQSDEKVSRKQLISLYFLLPMLALENAEGSLSKGLLGDITGCHRSLLTSVAGIRRLVALALEALGGHASEIHQELAELKCMYLEESKQKKQRLSLGGKISAAAKHERGHRLKSWAIERFESRANKKLNETQYARILSNELPEEFKNIFDDVQRVIKTALLKHQKMQTAG